MKKISYRTKDQYGRAGTLFTQFFPSVLALRQAYPRQTVCILKIEDATLEAVQDAHSHFETVTASKLD